MQIQIEGHVREFILSLDLDTQVKYKYTRELLEKFGNMLRMPYSKKVANGLFELRIRGQQEVRIFYVFYKNCAWLLHGFIKKSQITPQKEIKTALGRKKLLTRI